MNEALALILLTLCSTIIGATYNAQNHENIGPRGDLKEVVGDANVERRNADEIEDDDDEEETAEYAYDVNDENNNNNNNNNNNSNNSKNLTNLIMPTKAGKSDEKKEQVKRNDERCMAVDCEEDDFIRINVSGMPYETFKSTLSK